MGIALVVEEGIVLSPQRAGCDKSLQVICLFWSNLDNTVWTVNIGYNQILNQKQSQSKTIRFVTTTNVTKLSFLQLHFIKFRLIRTYTQNSGAGKLASLCLNLKRFILLCCFNISAPSLIFLLFLWKTSFRMRIHQICKILSPVSTSTVYSYFVNLFY